MTSDARTPLAHGVTEAMIETYGDVIFRLSLNHQRRLGDPARALDFEEVARQRENTGLTDEAIAQKTGLGLRQVVTIRNIVERRRFRRDQYRKLFDLGGGRRYRDERYRHPREIEAYGDRAERLRHACHYHPKRARHFIEEGWWRGQTFFERLRHHAADSPDAPALIGDGGAALSWADLAVQSENLARTFLQAGLQRGDVIAIALPPGKDAVLSCTAAAAFGFVAQLLPADLPGHRQTTLMDQAHAAALIAGRDGETIIDLRGDDTHGPVPLHTAIGEKEDGPLPAAPVGADPAAMLYREIDSRAPLAAIHTHQALLAQLPGIAETVGIGTETRLFCPVPPDHWAGLLACTLVLSAGAALTFSATEADLALVTASWSGPSPANTILVGETAADIPADGTGTVLIGGPELPVIALGGEADRGFLLPEGSTARAGDRSVIEIDSPMAFAGYLDQSAANMLARTGDGWLVTELHGTIGKKGTLELGEESE